MPRDTHIWIGGFEPPTSRLRSERAAKLRYTQLINREAVAMIGASSIHARTRVYPMGTLSLTSTVCGIRTRTPITGTGF
jgi:hypothetical protein